MKQASRPDYKIQQACPTRVHDKIDKPNQTTRKTDSKLGYRMKQALRENRHTKPDCKIY